VSKGEHPNVVTIIKHGRVSELYYIDMEICQGNLEEYIQGTDLQRFEATINRHFAQMGMCEVRRFAIIWDIMEQIACGLSFLHDCGEEHRDIKPRNSTLILTFVTNCVR